MNITVKMIPSMKMIIITRNGVVTKHYPTIIRNLYFLVIDDFTEQTTNIFIFNLSPLLFY